LPGRQIRPARAVTVTTTAASVQYRDQHRPPATRFIITKSTRPKKINQSKTPARHQHPQ